MSLARNHTTIKYSLMEKRLSMCADVIVKYNQLVFGV